MSGAIDDELRLKYFLKISFLVFCLKLSYEID